MEIRKDLISGYLQNVTVSYFGGNDDRPDDVADYDPYIEDMRLHALRDGNLEQLRLGFAYILAHPEIDVIALADSHYTFSPADVRAIISHAYETIWPDAEPFPPAGPLDVTLID